MGILSLRTKTAHAHESPVHAHEGPSNTWAVVTRLGICRIIVTALDPARCLCLRPRKGGASPWTVKCPKSGMRRRGSRGSCGHPRAHLTERASRCWPQPLNAPSDSGCRESLGKAHRGQQEPMRQAWPAPSLFVALSGRSKHIVKTVRGDLEPGTQHKPSSVPLASFPSALPRGRAIPRRALGPAPAAVHTQPSSAHAGCCPASPP